MGKWNNVSYLSIGLDQGPTPAWVDLVTTVRAEVDPEKTLSLNSFQS